MTKLVKTGYYILILLMTLCFSSLVFANQHQPEDQIAQFFKLLQANKIQDAYQDIFQGNQSVKINSPNSQTTIRQIEFIKNNYGKMIGFDLIKHQEYGHALSRYTYILRSAHYPTIWNFYYYKPAGHWFLLTFRFNDRLTEMD